MENLSGSVWDKLASGLTTDGVKKLEWQPRTGRRNVGKPTSSDSPMCMCLLTELMKTMSLGFRETDNVMSDRPLSYLVCGK